MLRDYQQKAIELLYAWFASGETGNPCLVLPTGAGKSHIIAALVKDAIKSWPGTRILMTTSSKELILQNAEKMRQHWPNAPMGIYSASLRRKCLTEPITYAGIQSISKKGNELGHIDLMIVDECDTINTEEEGQYRALINDLLEINPAMRVIGLTGTPYKLGHGMIHEGENVIFSDLIEPITIEELIKMGHLCQLISKHTSFTLSTEGVGKARQEFIPSQLEKIIDTHDNNIKAVRETLQRAPERNHILVFCSGVSHSEHIRDLFRAEGVTAEAITGKTPSAERDRIIKDFKAGKVRVLCNMNVLSVGFDAPLIDCIVFLRPTMSARLYVQMAGRGLRTAPGKVNCKVLDFAGVVAEHGPITAIVPPRRGRKGEGVAPTKVCPQCDETVSANARVCTCCGHAFPPPETTEKTVYLRGDDIMGIEPTEMRVKSWKWKKHTSRASGNTMLMVKYYGKISDQPIAEYMPVQNEGFAGHKARTLLATLASKSGAAITDDLDDMAESLNTATPPTMILHKRDGKFHRVIDRIFA